MKRTQTINYGRWINKFGSKEKFGLGMRKDFSIKTPFLILTCTNTFHQNIENEIENLVANDRHVSENKLDSFFCWEIINFPAAFSNLPIIILSEFTKEYCCKNLRMKTWLVKCDGYKKRNHFLPEMDCLPSVEHFKFTAIYDLVLWNLLIQWLTSFRIW